MKTELLPHHELDHCEGTDPHPLGVHSFVEAAQTLNPPHFVEAVDHTSVCWRLWINVHDSCLYDIDRGRYKSNTDPSDKRTDEVTFFALNHVPMIY